MYPYARALEVDAPELADRLDTAMRNANMSGRALARAARVNKETISRWRRGERTRVQMGKVERVAAELGLDVVDLVGPAASRGASRAGSPAGSSADGLLEEMAGLASGLEELELRVAPDLVAALDAHRERTEALEAVVPELRRLAERAKRWVDRFAG